MKEDLIKEIRDELDYLYNISGLSPEIGGAILIAKSNLYIALATLVNK